MVNNGIHWASDYPLGIALGYFFGKSALKMAKPVAGIEESVATAKATAWLDPDVTAGFDELTGQPVPTFRWEF